MSELRPALSETLGEQTSSVELAILRRPWGRRGDLLLALSTDWPESRFAGGQAVKLLHADGREETRTVEQFRTIAAGPMLKFVGVDSIDAARRLAGAAIVAPAQSLSRPTESDWWQVELIGAEAVDADSNSLGKIIGFQQSPSGWLLVIDHRGQEVLVPCVSAICRRFDRDRKLLEMTPPVGLFDPTQAEEA